MDAKTYYPWIDWAKFCGIYLVIIGHGWLLDELWKVYVYSFHMPCFFLLSGLLFKYKPMSQLLRNDWKRLIIPYLLMNLFFLLRSILIGIMRGTLSANYFFSRLGAIMLGCGYPNHNLIPVCDTSWFIAALFFMHIIVTAIRSWPVWTNWIAMVLFVGLAVLLLYMGVNIVTSFNSALLAIPFFYLGINMQPLLSWITRQSIPLRLIVGIIGGAITCWLSVTNGRVDVDLCLWGNNLGLFYIAALIGSFSLITICSTVQKEIKIVRTISKGTIFILGFNLYFISICGRVAEHLPFYHHNNFYGLVLGAMILFICYFLILFLQRFFPIILGNRK